MKNVLFLVSEVRISMQLGLPLANSLDKILQSASGKYSKQLKKWLVNTQNGRSVPENLTEISDSPEKRALLVVFQKGLQGSPVDGVLKDFEQELIILLENQYERKIQMLPIKLMIPLVFFILPSVIILLLAPLLITLGALK